MSNTELLKKINDDLSVKLNDISENMDEKVARMMDEMSRRGERVLEEIAEKGKHRLAEMTEYGDKVFRSNYLWREADRAMDEKKYKLHRSNLFSW